MVPIWSAAQAAGLAAREVPRLERGHGRGALQADPRQRRRGDQAQGRRGVRRRAVDPRRRSTPIALDQKRILPVSSLVDGTYGIRDVCLSVPTVVGRKGVESPARDRALAQGGLGAPALGPGPPRDDRRGVQEQSQGRPARPQPAGPARRAPAPRTATARARPGDDGRRRRRQR